MTHQELEHWVCMWLWCILQLFSHGNPSWVLLYKLATTGKQPCRWQGGWWRSTPTEEEASLVVVLAEILHRREEHIQQQNTHCTYLTHSDLNPSPHFGTPWQHMHARGNNCAFITTMGIDITNLQVSLGQSFAETWNAIPIPCSDTSLTALPCIDHHSLDAAGALGLILHHLTSTLHKLSFQQIFGLIPSTVKCYLSFSLKILLSVLHKIPAAHIKWPHGIPSIHLSHHWASWSSFWGIWLHWWS